MLGRFAAILFAVLLAACSSSDGGLPATDARAADSSGHRYLFAPSFASNIVSVYDLDSGRLAASIPAQARGPCCAHATPDGRTVFVVDGLSPYVTRIDVATLQVSGLIRLNGFWGDRGVPIRGDGSLFWISTLPDGFLEAIDTASNEVVRSFPLISNTFTLSRDGQTLYSANTTTLPTAFAATATTFAVRSPDSGKVLATAILPLALENSPLQMYVSPDERKVYVQMLGATGVVHVVDVSDRTRPRYMRTVKVGAVPIVAGFTPDGSQLWFPNSGDGTVSILDVATDTIVHVIDIGPYVAGVAILGERAYVSVSPGIIANPVLSQALLFAGLIPGAAVTPPDAGSTVYRPLLELPGEVLTFDARTYRQLPLPPMPLPSASHVIEVVDSGG
ncbi:MAG TPA: hypothetical protein VLI06_02185 [Solimonas sp.]|nr:hypothetical protein [Solimonas sp.]